MPSCSTSVRVRTPFKSLDRHITKDDYRGQDRLSRIADTRATKNAIPVSAGTRLLRRSIAWTWRSVLLSSRPIRVRPLWPGDMRTLGRGIPSLHGRVRRPHANFRCRLRCRPQSDISRRDHLRPPSMYRRYRREWIHRNEIASALFRHSDVALLHRLVVDVGEARLEILKGTHLFQLFFDPTPALKR